MKVANNKGKRPRKVSVTAAIITCNEEDNIGDCLDSLSWVDEVVIVDSGSVDRTVEICRERGSRVFYKTWTGFTDQKNFAREKSSGDWVLYLDADERVTPALRDNILSRLASTENIFGYWMNRRNYYLGRPITHAGWFPDWKLRLAQKGYGVWIGGPVHEFLGVEGPTTRLEGLLEHYTCRSFSDHLKKITLYSLLAAEKESSRGKGATLAGLLLRPPFKFFWMYFFRLGFLDGWRGLMLAILSSYDMFLRHAKLREIQMR